VNKSIGFSPKKKQPRKTIWESSASLYRKDTGKSSLKAVVLCISRSKIGKNQESGKNSFSVID